MLNDLHNNNCKVEYIKLLSIWEDMITEQFFNQFPELNLPIGLSIPDYKDQMITYCSEYDQKIYLTTKHQRSDKVILGIEQLPFGNPIIHEFNISNPRLWKYIQNAKNDWNYTNYDPILGADPSVKPLVNLILNNLLPEYKTSWNMTGMDSVYYDIEDKLWKKTY